MALCYLIDSTYVSTTGKLHGKSLRCYEANRVEPDPLERYGRSKYTATGRMYTVKNGKIICKSTSATLAHRYTWRYNETQTATLNVPTYGSTTFASPELALGAKYLAIKANLEERRQVILASLAKLDADTAAVPDCSFILVDHPELFI